MPASQERTMADRARRKPDEARMSFGEHLEELRRRLLIGLAGVLVGAIVCLAFAGQIFAFICQPAIVVLQRHGQMANLQVLDPAEPFVIYLRVGLICGLILSSPWLIWQIWLFVSAGLYPHEQRWIRLFAPASIVLFALGVAFMFYIVLPIVLNYLVAFGRLFPYPGEQMTVVQRVFFGREKPEPATTTQPSPSLPVLQDDPKDPQVGDIWYNATTRQVRCRTPKGVQVFYTQPAGERSLITNQFRLREYVGFVLMLSLGFGAAFQLPLVVIFLTLLGIVSTERVASARKYVILLIVVFGAMLTPPDIGSQILLAVPMILLFELGLVVSRALQRRRAVGDSPT
jgi:sec-independent protein translocase protein TatC